jgi:pentatricopeptide repeat protein
VFLSVFNRYARYGQMDKALSRYREAIDAGARAGGSENKFVAMAHNNVCVELDIRGQLDEAHEHCKKAATILPNFW